MNICVYNICMHITFKAYAFNINTRIADDRLHAACKSITRVHAAASKYSSYQNMVRYKV